ncbi:translation initiation factor IF-2 [Candidatus Cyanaurora vandensis]|uniref:translation initiation factor IF-2 n=1 Tax=Candidatus Cyanaurora vandensis TaxID=2714958 RepID=UPI00257D3A0E|nr:translation initiation factor IF-2 [Candidatus Cyanaurora vandensis]
MRTVRIYDLAKELNRENRDILVICDNLGITYKSHSSTITEEEAQAIRKAVRTTRMSAGSMKPGVKPAIAAKSPEVVDTRGKQQILQVYRPPVNAVVRPAAELVVAPAPEPVPAVAEVIPAPAVPVVVLPEPVVKPVVVELPPPPVAVTPPAPVEVPLPKVEALPPKVEATPPVVVVAPPVVEVPVAPVELPLPPLPTPKVATAVEPPPGLKPKRTRREEEEEAEEASAKSKRKTATPAKAGEPARAETPRHAISRPTAKTPSAPTRSTPAPRKGPSRPIPAGSSSSSGGGSGPVGRSQRGSAVEESTVPKIVVLTGATSIQDLAAQMRLPPTELIKALFLKRVMVTINQLLEIPTAEMVAAELGFEVQRGDRVVADAHKTEMLDLADLDHLLIRPPVVTIMGHVDHGKTSLLDAIRTTKVAQGEAGGITQHIGAYVVPVPTGDTVRRVVFLDTPGHAAFTAMRARGAKVTDIAVLVVAADDGVMPQTKEAISHAQAAGVPIVVAINKVDKPDANPDRVKQELAEYNLVPEEWGGETIMVPVSARERINLDLLLEMLLLQADILDLQANPDRNAKGTIIEAHLDKNKGPVATVLVQNGTLRVGDTFVVGPVLGKVRAMFDDQGQPVTLASPSIPVEVMGFSQVPAAGDELEVYADEREARRISEERTVTSRNLRLNNQLSTRRISLGTLSAQAQEGELKELNLILKADVQGSVEAIIASLNKLPQTKVQLRILLTAAGEVSEADIDLALASRAVIFAFNTTIVPNARTQADNSGVDIREYDVIYKLLEDAEDAMAGLLEPELVEESLGVVEVRKVIPVGKLGKIAGCYVREGKVIRNCQMRVRRAKAVVFEGQVDSLKRFKDDAREVATGFECGVGSDQFSNWEESDLIETFRMVTRKRSLV